MTQELGKYPAPEVFKEKTQGGPSSIPSKIYFAARYDVDAYRKYYENNTKAPQCDSIVLMSRYDTGKCYARMSVCS